MRKKFSQICLSIAVFLLAIITVAFIVDYISTLPDVHFSYATNQCVEVVNYSSNDNYTCDNLPPKFYHVWVK